MIRDVFLISSAVLASRARETAEIVADVFAIKNIVELPLLKPDADKHALIEWLKKQPASATIAIVGHEPHLSAFTSLLVAGDEQPILALKKGACCLVEFDEAPGIDAGVLLGLLQPGQLRKIDD